MPDSQTPANEEPPSEAVAQLPRDASYWASVAEFNITHVPTGALSINVQGREAVGPLQGFGQMWQKIIAHKNRQKNKVVDDVFETVLEW